MSSSHTWAFLKQLFAKPGSTGAVLPSSRELAVRMVDFASPADDAVIAEFGPGTGVFTGRILETLKPDQRFFAIEINEDFARILRVKFPQIHLHVGSAADVAGYCREEGLDRVDCVVSGLPWANFPDALQKAILDGMMEVMPAGGVFVTFAYLQGLVLPTGRRFKRHLAEYFSTVEISPVVWRNFPPAIIYRCRK